MEKVYIINESSQSLVECEVTEKLENGVRVASDIYNASEKYVSSEYLFHTELTAALLHLRRIHLMLAIDSQKEAEELLEKSKLHAYRASQITL